VRTGRPPNTARQFWAQVASPNARGCTLWTGGTRGNPKHPYNFYGVFQVSGKRFGAHRYAWEISRGPIPDGLKVLHVCDEPLCCNVEHLFIGTSKDNTEDMHKKGRHWTLAGEGQPNHKLTEEQVAELRMRRTAGETFQSLADAFGICIAQAYRIAKHQQWRKPSRKGQVV
jgi:hypothetical protein